MYVHHPLFFFFFRLKYVVGEEKEEDVHREGERGGGAEWRAPLLPSLLPSLVMKFR